MLFSSHVFSPPPSTYCEVDSSYKVYTHRIDVLYLLPCNLFVSIHPEEMYYHQLETAIHHGESRCCWITYRWFNIDKGHLRTCPVQRQPEARCGPTHWDTETVCLVKTTRRQFLVRGQFKEPGFCLLSSHCLPVRGWAPKENKSGGSADVYICVSWHTLRALVVKKNILLSLKIN